MSRRVAGERGYQFDWSKDHPRMLDQEFRTRKARKILAVLNEALGSRDPSSMRALDVGASAGIIVGELGRVFGEVVGIDIDENGIQRGRQFLTGPNQELRVGDAMNMPFEDESFDVAVLNHVYEHMPDADRLFEEVWRVLVSGGIAYVGAQNRLAPMEPHLKLLGLSWLPPRLADAYVRRAGKGERYYERPRSFRGLKRMTARFEFEDWTLRVIRNPARYAAEDVVRRDGLVTKLPRVVLSALHPFIPTYILVLRKPASDRHD
jgi:ubiquinone/menaquinone biosynthesis C-methylase UbiE